MRALTSLSIRHEFIQGMKLRIEMQRQMLRTLKSDAESRLETLVEAAKERKTLDKLKERRLEEHKKVVKKKELKAMDELVTTRFKREGRT
jgi:flagellar protein FliJ